MSRSILSAYLSEAPPLRGVQPFALALLSALLVPKDLPKAALLFSLLHEEASVPLSDLTLWTHVPHLLSSRFMWVQSPVQQGLACLLERQCVPAPGCLHMS